MISIISEPNYFLKDILDVDHSSRHISNLIGNNHTGMPRPFPHGLWFRGHANASWRPVPQLFRRLVGKDQPFYEESDMFQDIRLRHSNTDLRGYNNFELMCIMQHHRLPTRLLDWSENILIAAYFAIERNFREFLEEPSANNFDVREATKDDEGTPDAAIYILNAFRLNQISNISSTVNAGIAMPNDLDVVIRSLMAEHTYLESVFEKANHNLYTNRDSKSIKVYDLLENYFLEKRPESFDETKALVMINRLNMPIAVMPKRNHARMDSQLSTFTVHGGKIYYDRDHRNTKAGDCFERESGIIIGKPQELVELNSRIICGDFNYGSSSDIDRPKQFLKKFTISKYAIKRLMIELDRLGIIEPLIFPDMENQSGYVKRRWSVRSDDREVINLPSLSKYKKRINATATDYKKLLYAKRQE